VPEKFEPVEIIVAVNGTQENFDGVILNPLVVEQLERYLPGTTFKHNHINDADSLVAQSVPIDYITIHAHQIGSLMNLGLLQDMTPLIEKFNYDMSKHSQGMIDLVRALDPEGRLIAMPGSTNSSLGVMALAYNKDIFDAFDVPYPHEGITWDEVIDLANRFGTRGDEEYWGLTTFFGFVPMMQSFELSYTNADGEIDLSNPKWAELFRLGERFYYEAGRDSNFTWKNFDFFFKERNIAMYFGNVRPLMNQTRDGNIPDFNWDMVAVPRLSQNEPIKIPPETGLRIIPVTSKNPDHTFKLIEILNSDEVVLGSQQSYFDSPEVSSKNLEALNVSNYETATYIPGKYDQQLNQLLVQILQRMGPEGKDINEAMNEFKQMLEFRLEELRAQE
jgi:multiple sugar transport system substrate-binding protein